MRVSSEHTPPPLTETPPQDRFCDLVLNGGVASGVVYPWAMLKLARHYRFKNIGGNSVGAMAAALAAAAEYGRCHGLPDAFEPLRRLPLVLAEEVGPRRTKMLSLFQAARPLRRPFELFLALVSDPEPSAPTGLRLWVGVLVKLYRLGPVLKGLAVLLALLLLVVFMMLPGGQFAAPPWLSLAALLGLGLLGAVGVVAITAIVLVLKLRCDLGALAQNGYGLCTGKGEEPGGEGLVEWLHRGIQLSAGRGEHDPLLTFADLWAAPRFGRLGPGPLPGGLQPPEPGIDLQMFTSNISQGRPVRLPLRDANTTLYYDPTEWAHFFPPYVLAALEAASVPYAPGSPSDPDPLKPVDREQAALMARVRELPSGGMPIVVAARLSLSFPVLFSCLPIWAVDYETLQGKRKLRKCLFTDGGLCSNFPVHLFDAAHPRWPTFAILLDSRLVPFEDQQVWLPLGEAEGRGDNWQREVPSSEPGRGLLSLVVGLVVGMVLTMKDWNDRVAGRLPHIRNRIVRMALRPGEGQLNIGMPGERIMTMAHAYGTAAAEQLLAAYEPGPAGETTPAWRQHLFVRAMVQLRALRLHLRNYAQTVRQANDTVPLRELLQEATQQRMLLGKAGVAPPRGQPGSIEAGDAVALERVIAAIESLEGEIAASGRSIDRYVPKLEPEMRLRPPV